MSIELLSPPPREKSSPLQLGQWMEELWRRVSSLISKENLRTYVESFTPTGSWNTNVTYTGFKWRNLEWMHCQVRVALSGAPNSTVLTVNIPDSLTIDTTKILSVIEPQSKLGALTYYDNGVGRILGEVVYGSTTTVSTRVLDDLAATSHVQSGVTDTYPVTAASGDSVFLNFSVPILEWAE
jgi:hypothetical protein